MTLDDEMGFDEGMEAAQVRLRIAEETTVSINLKDLIRIWELTDSNDHTGAVVELARLLKEHALHAEAAAIQREHIATGRITEYQQARRYEIRQQLRRIVKAKFGKALYYLITASL